MPNNENLGANFSIDVTDLKAGLSQANRLIRESESEFKSAAAGMDDWTKKEAGLTAKIKSLNQVTDIQQKKVDALQEQYDELIKKGLDPTSKEAVELRTKINNETAALEKNKKQTKDLETKLNEFREEAEKTGKTVDEVAQDIDDMGEEAKNAEGGFTTLRGAIATFAGNALTSLVSKLGEAVTSLASLSQETQEYREDIGKLKTAFESAGKTTESATAAYKELYSVIGEEDRSVEAVNHLAKLVDTEEELALWTGTILPGLWGTFGDSIPIEGLTEAANETAKVGKLTGVLADALNWAGVNEDDFQASLDKCNTEQERSKLITDTLNGLYSEAAELYKKNNKSVIEARKATSDYTDTMADLGEAMEPVNTEITSLKNEFAKKFAPVLKDKIIPSVQKFIKQLKEKGIVETFGKAVGFLAENFVTIAKVTLTAVTVMKTFSAVMAVHKTVTMATTAIKGLTAGVGLATKAQTIWNAVMAANPIGAVITAVGLLAGGIALLVSSNKDASESTDLLTNSQRETVESAKEAAEAYRENKAAADETAASQMANVDYVKNSLLPQLENLVDANGKVKEGEQGRAEFILGELNKALGTEYSQLSDIVDANGKIKNSIYEVIEAKQAQMLLETYENSYREAIEKLTEAEMARATNAQAIAKQKEVIAKQEAENEKYIQSLRDKGWSDYLIQTDTTVLKNGQKLLSEQNYLNELTEAYNESNANLQGYYKDIDNYTVASTLLHQGKTEEAIGYLNKLSAGFFTAEDARAEAAAKGKSTIEEQTEYAKKKLEQQVIDAEVNLQLLEAEYENAQGNMTDEQKKQAEQRIKDARKIADDAKKEYYEVGGNITKGIGEGAEAEKFTLSGAMTRVINSAVEAAKKAAGINSPSRLFRDEVGKFIPAGVSVGIDKGTGGVVKSIKKQVSAIRKAYNIDGIADKLTNVKSDLVTMRNNRKANAQTATGASVPTGNKSFTVNQYNNYSQEHSRYEMWKSEQNTKAALKLMLLGG